MLSTTFYLLAVAIGIAAGGVADLLGLSISWSLTIAALVSIMLFILVRNWKKKLPKTDSAQHSLDIGQVVSILEWRDNRHARIQYRGTQWNAELINDETATAGETYEIAGQKGNIFLIRIRK